MNCDDMCEFRMGLNTSDPLTTTQIVYRGGYSNRRSHFREGASYSEWYNLTKGEQYYIYSRQREGWGGDNFGVGVEINQTAFGNESYVANHHHAMKEVQYFSLGVNDSQHEIFRITVNDVQQGGTYILRFQDPDDLSWYNSAEIAAYSGSGTIRSAIYGYFNSKWGSDISVNWTRYDSNATETESSSNTTDIVYYVKVKKLIPQ
jgi:hypothetical protein